MSPENQNLYSISDLAEQVGVPRTTITDWLGKYARFIELQTQGRRRFYTDRTLSVLCKIAELRAAGRSIGDIDGELERIFPVHPTVEPPDATSEDVSGSAGNTASPDAANPNQDQQNYPVVKQEDFDEMFDKFGSKFADLCDAMSAVNRKADTAARRLRLMLAVAIMIIVVLSGFLVLFYVNFLVQRDNTAASRNAASAIAAFSAGSETRENALRAEVGGLSGNMSGLASSVSGMEERVSGLAGSMSGLEGSVSGIAGNMSGLASSVSGMEERVSGLAGSVYGIAGNMSGLASSVSGMEGRVSGLAGSVSGMNDELQKLRADLPAQRAAFEAAIEEMKRASGSAMEAQQAQFEARIALEKEQFAAERLKLLQQIESLQESLSQATAADPARDEEIRKLRDELAVQTERNRNVDKLNEEMSILSGRIEDLREKNQILTKDLAEANKRAEAEAEARKKAESDARNARRATNSFRDTQPSQPGGYPEMQ